MLGVLSLSDILAKHGGPNHRYDVNHYYGGGSCFLDGLVEGFTGVFVRFAPPWSEIQIGVVPPLGIRFAPEDLATGGGAGRGFGDILKDPGVLKKWLKHKHPVGQPLSPGDAKRLWDTLKQLGYNPDFHEGHRGGIWKDPHIQVGGNHIPVDPTWQP
jgi:hypothetical protein